MDEWAKEYRDEYFALVSRQKFQANLKFLVTAVSATVVGVLALIGLATVMVLLKGVW